LISLNGILFLSELNHLPVHKNTGKIEVVKLLIDFFS